MISKISLWVVSGIYALALLTFLFIIPVITNKYYLENWVTQTGIVHNIIIYIISIYSALITIFLFKTPQEDGTDLLVNSKPIIRTKIVFAKFICFVSCITTLSTLGAIVGSLCYLAPYNNNANTTDLILSLFLTTLVLSLVFSGISMLVAIKFNKVLIFFTNIFIVVFGIVYSTIITSIQQSAAALISKDHSVNPSPFTYYDKKGIPVGAQSITSTDGEDLEKYFKSMEFESELEYWNEKEAKASQDAKNAFNYIGQFQLMFNLNSLQDVYKNTNAITSLGNADWYKYKPIAPIHDVATTNIDKTDDDPSWMDFTNEKLPYFFTQIGNIKEETLREMANYNKSPQDLEKLITGLTNIAFSQKISYLTNKSYIYNGSNISKNKKEIDYSIGSLTTFERDFFNYLLFETLYDSGSNLYGDNSMKRNQNGYYSYDFTSTTPDGFMQYIEYVFGKMKEFSTKLNLATDYDYSLETLKFKNFLIRQLLGVYGTEDYTFKENEFLDSSGGKIVKVDWNNYFKLAFLTQYNSINIRNIEDISDSTKGDFSKTPRDLFKNGTAVFPYIGGDTTWDWIKKYVEADTKKFSTEYDGTIIPTEYAEQYKQYNALDPSQTNQYGYFSDMIAKSTSLINTYAGKYQNGEFLSTGWMSNHYSNYVKLETMSLCSEYERATFNYDCAPRINPTNYVVWYFFVGIALISIAYVKYLKYDFS